MTPFKQPIRPGQSGSDVTAVKRALRKMHIHGYESLSSDDHAGSAFVNVLKNVQRAHGLVVDGVYGPGTHSFIAPNFDAYGIMLYKSAKIRPMPLPPMPTGNAQTNAKKLLVYHAQGLYVARNAGDLSDIQHTAQGDPVWSQHGLWVHIDARVFELLVWLIEDGHKIGTYAICSDHHDDGLKGHAGGKAVDIEWIDGVAVGLATARDEALTIAKLLHQVPAGLNLRQLICGGYGYIRDNEISGYSIPGSDSYYGSVTMSEHCNHLHAGF